MPPLTGPTSPRPPYQAMTLLSAPATRRSEVWRTLCGVVLWMLLTLLVIVALTVPVVVVYGPLQARQVIAEAMSVNTPAGVIGLLFAFLSMALGLCLTLILLMRRSPLTLIGPVRPFLRDFARVGLPLVALWLVLLPLSLSGDDVTPHLTLAQLTPWLPAALLGLLVQTGTEELVFRGYLQQQLAARFPTARWVWLILPSALFGAAHYSGVHGLGYGLLTCLWAACFGLAAADLTARTGNLGAALALHFTNNVFAILVVGAGGQLGGLSLYSVIPSSDTAALLYYALDFIGLWVAWLLARLVLRR